jgi:hypothetical protein
MMQMARTFMSAMTDPGIVKEDHVVALVSRLRLRC